MLLLTCIAYWNSNQVFYFLTYLIAFVLSKNQKYLTDAKFVDAPRIKLLSKSRSIPIVGLGTSKANGDELVTALEAALEAGYKHIDTAAFYENEHEIGAILKRYIDSGKVNRSDLFITTKLPPVGNRKSDVKKYFEKSRADLQLEYIDLYLVHWPFGFAPSDKLIPTDNEGNLLLDNSTNHQEIWQEMESLVDSNLTRAIGLSNFNRSQITKVLAFAKIRPAVLQIESHLYFQQQELYELCKNNQIVMTAYSPLGSGKSFQQKGFPSLFEVAGVVELAKKYNKSPAQIILKFNVQRGVVVIPKSVTPSRIQENIDLFDFELTSDDMETLKALDKGESGRLIKFDAIQAHPESPF